MIAPLPRPPNSRLAMRLVLAMALAGLPVAVVTYVQTTALEDEVRARAEEGLLGNTMRVAEAEIGMIRKAQGLMAGLAQAVPMVVHDLDRCRAMMQRIASLNPEVALVAFVPKDGTMRCSTAGQVHDVSDNPAFQRIRDQQTPTFAVSRKSLVTGRSVLGITHPVFDAKGAYLGYTALSLPHDALTSAYVDATLTADAAAADDGLQPWLFWSFDRDGNLLTASVELHDATQRVPLNHDLKTLVGQPAQVFQDVSRLGAHRTYAVVPVIENELYLMSSWREGANGLVDRFRRATYLSPLLMWMAGFLVAGLTAERLVARHVRTLHRAIRAFARGDRRLDRVDLSEAPLELRELGDTYVAMTEAITLGEAELEDTVHQKDVLLREVHHRAKNNLQLIFSIMNIQRRKTASAESRALLKDLHDRVMTLGTIQSELYQTSGKTDVSAGELLRDVARQISAMPFDGEVSPRVHLDIDAVSLAPEQAVPLSLLLAEALTNAIKSSDKFAEVQVRLKRSGEAAVLEVLCTRPQGLPLSADTLLGQKLIAAFAQQLRGTLGIRSEGTLYSVAVSFHVAPLRAAERARGDDGLIVPA